MKIKIKEVYTIVTNDNNYYYDINDEKFYPQSQERTLDYKEYLKMLMKANPVKFHNCKIVKC